MNTVSDFKNLEAERAAKNPYAVLAAWDILTDWYSGNSKRTWILLQSMAILKFAGLLDPWQVAGGA